MVSEYKSCPGSGILRPPIQRTVKWMAMNGESKNYENKGLEEPGGTF